MQLAQPRGYEPLPFLGVFVLGVFRQVAVRARHLDFLRQLVVQLVLQGGYFVLELLLDFLG